MTDTQFHVNENARAARGAHVRMMHDQFVTLHVYYRARQLEAFTDEDSFDTDWTLAFPERVPGNLTADQLVAWFAARTGRVPYLVNT